MGPKPVPVFNLMAGHCGRLYLESALFSRLPNESVTNAQSVKGQQFSVTIRATNVQQFSAACISARSLNMDSREAVTMQ